jgi:hypothetical protein
MSIEILQKLKEGAVPLGVRQAAARGVLPVTQEELLAILVFLKDDPDEAIRTTAQETLEVNFDDEALKKIAESSSTPIEVLEYLGRPPLRSPMVLELLIQNKSVPDSTVAGLAALVGAGLMDLILVNLMRLLRSPFILVALEGNANQTPDIRRRLREIREEFFEKRNTYIPIHRTKAEETLIEEVQAGEMATPPEPGTAMVVYSDKIEEGEDVMSLTLKSLEDDGVEGTPSGDEDDRVSTIRKIATMTVAERVQAALKGGREERIILIRDSNRLVAEAVLDSPKISDSEVESFAQMKNVSEEVLRILSTRREFVKNYSVIRNLVKNPKTPLATSLGLLNRILTTDLKVVSRDKNIPETLRKMAQRQHQLRTTPKDSKY